MKGRGKEGRKQGQPATTKQQGNKRKHKLNKGRQQARGAHNKQAEQRNEKGGGKGRESTHEPKPWQAEKQTAQSRTGNKAKTQQWDNWSRTAKGRDNRKGYGEGRVGREMREKTKKDGKEKGGGVSQVMRAASMDPPGIPKYPGSHQERGEGGLWEVGMIYFLLLTKHSRPYGPFLSCGVFHSLVTFTNAHNLYTAAWKPIPTRTGSCHKNSNVLRYPILHIERTNGTQKSVRLCPLTLLLIE